MGQEGVTLLRDVEKCAIGGEPAVQRPLGLLAKVELDAVRRQKARQDLNAVGSLRQKKFKILARVLLRHHPFNAGMWWRINRITRQRALQFPFGQPMPDMTKRLRDQGGGLFIEGPFVVESGRDFFRAFHLVDERVRDRRRFLVDNAVAGGEPQRVVVSLFQRCKAARQPGMATRDFQENAVRGGVGRHESGVVAGLAQIGLAIVDATGIAAPSVAPVVFKVTAARIERREAFAA